MPKTKVIEKEIIPKKKDFVNEEDDGIEIVPGEKEDGDDEELDEEATILDDDEVDPFKDKWEE